MNYPVARVEPKAVSFGPVTYTDPFAWLEEETPESHAWQSQQDDLATRYLRALPQYESFLAQQLQFMAGSQLGIATPVCAGGRWFRAWVPDGEDLAVLEVAAGPAERGRRIVDCNADRGSEPLSINGFMPSPDGRKVTLVLGRGGRDDGEFRVLEVDTGEVLVDRLEQVRPGWIAWLPDSSGFYYAAYPEASATAQSVYLLRLGQPLPTQPEAIEATHPVLIPRRAADGRHLFIFADHLNNRPDYVRDVGAGGEWRPFLKGVPSSFRGDIIGERFIALTDEDAPTGRIVSIPLATPTDRSTWKELLPASDNVLATLMVFGERYVLVDLVDTYSRVRVFRADGMLDWEVPLPEPGVVNQFSGPYLLFNMVDCVARGDGDEITFVFSSLRTSPALYRARLQQRTVERLTEPHTRLDAVVHDYATQSADGARVAYRVLARRDLDLAKPQPTIIFGYGGFQAAMVPGWTHFAAWVRRGGVLVLAHLRGGGEFGPEWWHRGRLKHKQNTFNDVHAIAEDLIRRGITSPRQLGVQGGSNGGTMAAAVAVQRPDLYRATNPQVPITDIFARVRDAVSMASTLDYGDPRDPELSRVIRGWSPYQNVREGVAYPSLYIDSGLNDPRCPPWHGRKLAARVQQATTSGRPVLLRVRAGAGHGAVGRQATCEQLAEMMAFFADQLGLE